MSTPATIRVGNLRVELPEGVTLSDWALERRTCQNPRIRAYLGCIRLLEEEMDSNFAILHCSPERLRKIRQCLVEVLALIRRELAPLLRMPSRIPALEAARRNVERSYEAFERTVVQDLEMVQEMPIRGHASELRPLLCVAVGKAHGFLVDSFGQIMAADPRSQHDADYFLSRRFRRDIEEAEWLYSTVDRLRSFLSSLNYLQNRLFRDLSELLDQTRELPRGRAWDQVKGLIDLLLEELNPRLKEILALRGIRYSEMEMLDRHTVEIPARCRVLLHLDRSGRRLAPGPGQAAAQSVIAEEMAAILAELDDFLQDLSAFVPLWLESISLRRALMLRKPEDVED